MKKTKWMITAVLLYAGTGNAQNSNGNNSMIYPNSGKQPVNSNQVPANRPPSPVLPNANPLPADTNQNSMYNNNSLQYNRGNSINNNVPQGNGTYYTPGSQGINNTNQSGVYTPPK